LENKKIEKINLESKFFQLIKENQITSKGLKLIKKSLLKNQTLKEINLRGIL
jgi:hypothetical protein